MDNAEKATGRQGATLMALEYQSSRADGIDAVHTLNNMVRWRERVIESLLACAEVKGLPEDIQALVLELQCEVRALTSTLAKAALPKTVT